MEKDLADFKKNMEREGKTLPRYRQANERWVVEREAEIERIKAEIARLEAGK